MDISIKDLIVQMERPGSGLRGLASQSALGTASSTSFAAFNDLLRSIDLANAASDSNPPPAPDRSPDRAPPPQRPAQNNDSSRQANIKADRSDTDSNTDQVASNAQGTGKGTTSNDTTGNDSTSNDTAAKNANAVHTSSGSDDDTVARSKPHHATHKPAAKVAGTVQTATFVAPTQVAAAVVPVATTDASTDRGAPAAAAIQAADPQGKAGTATVAKGNSGETPASGATAADPKSRARSAQLADFENLKTPGDDPSLGSQIAALAKAKASGAANGKNAGKAAATPVGVANAATSTNGTGGDADKIANVTVQGHNGPGQASGGGSASTPLHAQTANGVLAAQEVGANPSPDGSEGTANHPGSQPQAGGGNSAVQGGAVNPATVIRPEAMGAIVNPAAGPQAGATPKSGPQITGLDAVNPAAAPQGGLPAGAASPQTTVATQAATRAQASAPVPLDEVSVHIARAAADGADRINIKLKPAALGNIDVKLQLTHDGRVTAVISADHSGTLNMLRRDAQGLQQALANAGLKADSGSLQFNMQNQNQGQSPFFGGNGNDRFPPPPVVSEPSLPAASQLPTSAIAGYANLRAGGGGLDIRV